VLVEEGLGSQVSGQDSGGPLGAVGVSFGADERRVEFGEFGPEKDLGVGTHPHCATDSHGNLHVVVRGSSTFYFTLSTSNTISDRETIPASTGSSAMPSDAD